MAESGKKTPKKKVTAKKVSDAPELVEELLEEDPDLLIEKYIAKNAGADEELAPEVVEEVPAVEEMVEEPVKAAPAAKKASAGRKKKAIVFDGFDEDDLIEAELELEDEKLLAEYGEPEVEVPVAEEVAKEVSVAEEAVGEVVDDPVLAAPAATAAEEAAAEAEAVPVKTAKKLDKGLLASILAILALAAIIGIILGNSAKNGGFEEVTHAEPATTVTVTTAAPTTTATTTAAPSTAVVTVQTPSAAEPEYRPDANGVLTAYRGSVEATDVTGLVYYDGVWYYLDKGKYVSDYFGIVGNEAGNWYVENGKVDFTVSGPRTINGQTVNFEYGKVVE
ncbi:MAG: hypothetical protein IIZ60_06785 [Clostridia bacterium]|nr:hypothetical protein [Clostridia bacterium]